MEIIKIAAARPERDCEDYLIVLRGSGEDAEAMGKLMRKPVTVCEADEFETAGNLVMEFIEERCIEGDDRRILFSDLYDAFSDWLVADNRKFIPLERRFGILMAEAGFKKEKAGRIYYLGLSLKDGDEADLGGE